MASENQDEENATEAQDSTQEENSDSTNVEEETGGEQGVQQDEEDVSGGVSPMPDLRSIEIPRRAPCCREGEELPEGGDMASSMSKLPHPCS